MFNTAAQGGLDSGIVNKGDLVVITAGVPVGTAGSTNLIKIIQVGVNGK